MTKVQASRNNPLYESGIILTGFPPILVVFNFEKNPNPTVLPANRAVLRYIILHQPCLCQLLTSTSTSARPVGFEPTTFGLEDRRSTAGTKDAYTSSALRLSSLSERLSSSSVELLGVEPNASILQGFSVPRYQPHFTLSLQLVKPEFIGGFPLWTIRELNP